MTRFLPIAALCVALIPAVAMSDDTSAVNDLLDKIIKAHGGEAALGKVVAFQCKLKGTTFAADKRIPMSSEITAQGYDKMMSVDVDPETKAETIEVINGDSGWEKVGDKETEKLSKDQVKSRLEMCYVNWLTTVFPLKQKEFRVTPIDEITISGHAADGLLVRHEKHDPVKLYFDKETHLLAKYERVFKNVEAGVTLTEEAVCSDYKTVQGVKQPFKMLTYWDGVRMSDIEVAELKVQEKPVDERLFSKP